MLLRMERINTATQNRFTLYQASPLHYYAHQHFAVTQQPAITFARYSTDSITARFLILTLAQELIASIRLLQSDYGVLNHMTNAQLRLQPPPLADSSLTKPASSPRPRPLPIKHSGNNAYYGNRGDSLNDARQ
jgi:hypothetical protein